MKQFTLFIIAIIISTSSYAQLIQVGKGKQVLEAKDKILLVRVYEKGDKELKEFDNVEEVVEMQNEMLKKVFSSGWDLNKSIEFVSKDEIDNLLNSNYEKYVVVDRFWSVFSKPSTVGKGKPGPGMYGSSSTKHDIFVLRYALPKDKKGKKFDNLFSMAFIHDGIGELDYLFFISQCKEYVNAAANGLKLKDESLWNPEKNIAHIKKSTLLLIEGSFKGELSDIKSNYCGKVELLPADQLYEKITTEPDGNIFMTILWSYKKGSAAYVLVDAKTFDMLGVLAMGGVKISIATSFKSLTGSGQTVISMPLYDSRGIKASHFKFACKAGAQKINY